MDQGEWEKGSAVYLSNKLNVPVLILHGGNDHRANLNQAIRLAEGLKIAGKTYESVIYPGRNHPLSNYANARDMQVFE
jgi:dipeptidyl aminopeptidase/acylaminoacyl peptidase